MAIEAFWRSVRSAVGFLLPRANVVPPGLDRDQIEAALRDATIWLTPGAVKGYNPDDFDFLSPEERTRLDDGVREFKAVAEAVPKKAPATANQIAEGAAAFRKIFETMRPDKYLDSEAFVIGKKVEGLIGDELPGWVGGMTFETKNDSIGDPALYITVLAEDDALVDEVLRENSRFVSDLFTQAAREICPDRWPYVWFRTVSGQEETMRAGRG